MLSLDAETHTYYWNGKVVPNVTRIIEPLYDFSGVAKNVLAAAAAFGTLVRRACELHDRNDLDESSLDESLRPYLNAWIAFRRDAAFEPTEIESRVFHPLLEYAGTFDRVGMLGGRICVLDIKATATMHPATGVQLAAYQEAINRAQAFAVTARCGVQLRENGSYRVHQYEDKDDFGTFLSLLNLYRWKERHGNQSRTAQ